MSVIGLGTTRRGFRVPVLLLLSTGMMLAALGLFLVELTRFSQERDILQTDVTVGGVPVTGLKLSDAAALWQKVYNQPIQLDFRGSPILMSPAEIGFHTNDDLMTADLRSQAAGTDNYWGDFWNYLWRKPTSPITVKLSSEYQEARLRNYLQDLAARYELRASTAAFDVNTMTFGAGANGTRLDIEGSMKLIDAALHRPTQRQVKLIMKAEGARSADMSTLRTAIQQYFTAKGFLPDGQSTLASVVVMDLQTGQELAINPDVAYSASSTMKIPIMITRFRYLDFTPNKDTRWFLGASILCSNNSASNYLIQESGAIKNTSNVPHNWLVTGLQRINETVQRLGAKNTFITAPFDLGDPKAAFNIPGPKTQPDPKFNAQPDPYNQTTAQDMAILLHHIYDCSQYGSGLLAAYPDAYTQQECKQMVELLSGNMIGRMIELGVPPGTRVAHKNGWGKAFNGYASNDAAIVFTPAGNYILSVYTWEKVQPGQEVGSIASWETIEGISRIVYNYFNADKPMLVARAPENKLTAIECVMPNREQENVDIDHINNGRFDAQGFIVPDACYNYNGTCDPIPAQKLGTQPDLSSTGGSGSSGGNAAPPISPPTQAPALPPTSTAQFAVSTQLSTQAPAVQPTSTAANKQLVVPPLSGGNAPTAPSASVEPTFPPPPPK